MELMSLEVMIEEGPLFTKLPGQTTFLQLDYFLNQGLMLISKIWMTKTPLGYADSRQMKTILIENVPVEIKSTYSEETLPRDGSRKGDNKQGRKSQEEWEPF